MSRDDLIMTSAAAHRLRPASQLDDAIKAWEGLTADHYRVGIGSSNADGLSIKFRGRGGHGACRRRLSTL